MNSMLLTVSRTGRVSNKRPRLLFRGGWLPGMGFVPGALVQALPEPDGMVFNLFNENIESYSDLLIATKTRGGSLLRVCLAVEKGYTGPNFATAGKYIYKGGLALGDPLVARYGYGVVRARKIDPCKLGFKNVKVFQMSSISDSHTGEPALKARLTGEWLKEAGFTQNSLVTAQFAKGSIDIRLHDEGIENYSLLVKYARENKMRLLQVADVYGAPHIGISGAALNKVGFGFGDMVAADYSHGAIKLQKLDFEKLGF
jgi:hypothetical protein